MSLDEDVTAIGAIADEARRALYRYVVAQPGPVRREDAAAAVDMPLHRARFHLEKLEQAGLLEADYARPAGRGGPGAGRPAKRYRRADQPVAVSLPPRDYSLAGSLLASAIDAAGETGEPVADAVARVAAERGRDMAAEHCRHRPERDGSEPEGTAISREAASADPLVDAESLLAEHGYEPRRTGRGIEMANCPFHALSRSHTALVCGMNTALLSGVVEGLAPERLTATLDPAAGRCCVVIERRAGAG